MATTSATTSLAQPTSSSSLTFASSEPVHISKDAVIWLALLGALGLIALTIALWLLLRYSCTRTSRTKGHQLYTVDRRNEHRQWWKHASPPVDASRSDASSLELAHLTKDGEVPASSIWPLPSQYLVGEKGEFKSRFTGMPALQEEII